MSGRYILGGPKGQTAILCENLLEWARWMDEAHKRKGRRVALTIFGSGKNRIRVSTVFLGLDYNFSAKGPPIIFETLIDGPGADEDMYRYSTWEEAEEGHRKLVEGIRASHGFEEPAEEKKVVVLDDIRRIRIDDE